MTQLELNHPLQHGRTAASRVVRAYHGERQPVTPVWFMRQAGRSLPEYRELRVGTRMLDVCLTPDLVSEITLQPVRRHGVDAAIFFSDIMVPLKLAGVRVEIEPGRGPVLAEPVRTASDVARLVETDPSVLDAALEPISAAVRQTVRGLAELGDGSIPLIGFAGAPFTLAAYLVEGGPSKDHLAARTMMHAQPEAWDALIGWLAAISGRFLRAQVLAGASAVQLFDSWAGSLSLADYTSRVAPGSRAALATVRDLTYRVADAEHGELHRSVPIVHFGVGTSELLVAMRDVGADVVGVDYRTSLADASRRLGHTVPVQGNIDPALLAAPWPVLEAHVRDIVAGGQHAPAHVLNLGHGVPPDTDPAVLTRLVEFVHAL